MCGYMIAPLGLSERQLLIYNCLYKKCNFENMRVSYTINQIATDIKIINLTDRIVNLEVKKMVELGYLIVIDKGSKGKPTTYEIVKYNDFSGNLCVTNTYVIGKLKDSDCNTSSDEDVTNTCVIGKSNVNPIKEKEKEKNIYSDSFNELWNLYPRKVGKPKAFSMYKKLRKKYEDIQIREAIEVYIKEIEYYKTDERFIKHGSTFFNCVEEDYIKANKKAPTGIGGNKNKANSSICNNQINNTPKLEGTKFI